MGAQPHPPEWGYTVATSTPETDSHAQWVMSRGTPKIGVRLSPDIWTRLGQAADAAGLTRAEVIRRLILWWLRQPGATVPPRPPGPDVDQIP